MARRWRSLRRGRSTNPSPRTSSPTTCVHIHGDERSAAAKRVTLGSGGHPAHGGTGGEPVGTPSAPNPLRPLMLHRSIASLYLDHRAPGAALVATHIDTAARSVAIERGGRHLWPRAASATLAQSPSTRSRDWSTGVADLPWSAPINNPTISWSRRRRPRVSCGADDGPAGPPARSSTSAAPARSTEALGACVSQRGRGTHERRHLPLTHRRLARRPCRRQRRRRACTAARRTPSRPRRACPRSACWPRRCSSAPSVGYPCEYT